MVWLGLGTILMLPSIAEAFLPGSFDACSYSGGTTTVSRTTSCTKQASFTRLLYSKSNQDSDYAINSPETELESPVLVKLLPSLLAHKQQYGHPNIPLGSSPGRQCATLRRLRIQNKLSEQDIQFMDEQFPDFTWHSLEDVYEQHDFEPLFERLLAYGDDYSPPKKYLPDPELGAWVTALRRLHKIDKVDPSHVEQLDAIGFSWISPRQCGSKFMMFYRNLLSTERIPLENPVDATLQWIRAQQTAHETLSQTRQQYMREVLGQEDWQNWKSTS